MNYYLKYLKYKQKYLDLKNLDLIGGLSLSKYNYNNLDGGVPGIASDYEHYAHLLDDYVNEEIADYWRTNVNSTTFSGNSGFQGVHQPGYYLMFYDSDGQYYDTKNDAEDDKHHPNFFQNHIHLLKSTIINRHNAISFTLKFKNKQIKILTECFLDAKHLNKYCKNKGIVGYDKLRMMIFLLKDFRKTYDYATIIDNQYDILLDDFDTNLTYEFNGVIHPILTKREINKCIETLETYAIICTAISKIDEINTGRTGEINLYEAMNPTQYNQYLREMNLDDFAMTNGKQRYTIRQSQIQDKKEEFLRKTKEFIEDSEKLIIQMSQVIFDFKSDYNIPFKEVFSQQLIEETIKEMNKYLREFYSRSDGTYETKIHKMNDDSITKTNSILEVMKNYNSLKQSLEENALKIREVNEDNSHHNTLKDIDLNINEMLALNEQNEPFILIRRYNWTEDTKLLLPELLSKLRKWVHWPRWYDWLEKYINRNIEYRRRIIERAHKLEQIKPHLEYLKKKEEKEQRLREAGSGEAGSGEAGSREAGSGEAGSGEAGSGEAGSGEAGSGRPIRTNYASKRHRPYAR